MLARDKRSSLFCLAINDEEKSLMTLKPDRLWLFRPPHSHPQVLEKNRIVTLEPQITSCGQCYKYFFFTYLDV
jgi:hypothetical protein